MLKLIFFLFQLFVLIFLVTYLSSNAFDVIFDIKQLQYTFSSNLLLFSLIIFLLLVFFIQLFYFKSRYNIKKYFLSKKSKNLEKGYNFFSQAMIALANKDNKSAIKSRNNMKKYLSDESELFLLLNSEILKIERKYEQLEIVHEKMINNTNTKTLGYKGLMEQNIKKQDYHHAFVYGEKLFELNPNIEKLYSTLVNIIGRTKNWNQLLYLTKTAYDKRIIDFDIFNMNTSIAYYEISKIKMYSDTKEALRLIKKAIKINKLFPPFIKLELDILLYSNQISQLKKLVRNYWSENQNSSLRNILSLFLKESKLGDMENIKYIIKNSTKEIESKKLLVDFAIYNSEWLTARENMSGLINNKPDREICEFMAMLELGEFNDKQKSDAWYLRAQNATLNEIWICKISNVTQTNWTSVSESGYFNSLEWKHPKMLGSDVY